MGNQLATAGLELRCRPGGAQRAPGPRRAARDKRRHHPLLDLSAKAVDEPRSYRVVKGFRVLAIVAAVAVYGQIVLGGVVRITGSGLGCPDWPACQGKIVPDFANSHVVIEYAHRLVGTTAGLLVLATAASRLALFYR